jgi:hypothetical protein
VSTVVATRIGLEVLSHEPMCAQFAWPLYKQLSEGYDECAVLKLEGGSTWRAQHRTARKRADRAARKGYVCKRIERHERPDEIQAINLSASHRQGRQMSAGYLLPPTTTPLPNYGCDRHGVHTYGVEDSAGLLAAYSWVYRAGDLALVSQILGHADRLADEIMYLLVQGLVVAESGRGGFLVYNRYDSGTEGLRFFKDRCGFKRTQVEWSQW